MKQQHGFTLVELSIVLVILGLLVGGVLTGQSLIRAAELRAITTESQRYVVAMNTFRDKYFAIPGDMPNAVRYWGQQAGGTADGPDSTCQAQTAAATGTATCNGDGSGLVGNGPSNLAPTEFFRFWQHLANAGLIEGTYSGVTGSGSNYTAVIGTNVPRSKVNNAGWFLQGLGTYGDASYFQANYGNYLAFGAARTNGSTTMPAIKAEEAYNIDMKTDDGKPNTGKVLSFRNSFMPACVATTDDAYLLSNTTNGCVLLFITGY